MAFFSIVIPLYNKADYVCNTLASVKAQSFQDFEVVVVDDCSTDLGLALAESCADDRFRFLRHDRNKGLSATRNTGIRHASADYVVFLDADDLWKPDFLERIRHLIDRFPQAGLFATAYAEMHRGGKLMAPRVNHAGIKPGQTVLVTDFFSKNLYQPIYNHSSLCVRKSLFNLAGHYDENVNFSEDVDFSIRANHHAPLAFDNTVASYYNAHLPDRITAIGIGTKTPPDLDRFLNWEKQNPSLKKYIDFERYVLAMHCKLANRNEEFQKFKSGIDERNLTLTQRWLLRLPNGIVRLIKKLKVFLLRRGWRISSY